MKLSVAAPVYLTISLIFSAILPATAMAEEAAADIAVNVGVVSDYRFRGISLSDKDPAVQGGIDLETGSGLFAGGWASTISEYGGSDVEVDLYGGYQGSAAGFDYALTGYAYVYPGGHGVNYVELQGSASRSVGPATVSVELAYAPNQKNTDTDNFYVSAGVEMPIPGTPVTAKLRGGRENGFYDRKWDWEAGISYSYLWLTASAAYVDTNYSGANEAGKLGKAGFVASLTAVF